MPLPTMVRPSSETSVAKRQRPTRDVRHSMVQEVLLQAHHAERGRPQEGLEGIRARSGSHDDVPVGGDRRRGAGVVPTGQIAQAHHAARVRPTDGLGAGRPGPGADDHRAIGRDALRAAAEEAARQIAQAAHSARGLPDEAFGPVRAGARAHDHGTVGGDAARDAVRIAAGKVAQVHHAGRLRPPPGVVAVLVLGPLGELRPRPGRPPTWRLRGWRRVRSQGDRPDRSCLRRSIGTPRSRSRSGSGRRCGRLRRRPRSRRRSSRRRGDRRCRTCPWASSEPPRARIRCWRHPRSRFRCPKLRWPRCGNPLG